MLRSVVLGVVLLVAGCQAFTPSVGLLPRIAVSKCERRRSVCRSINAIKASTNLKELLANDVNVNIDKMMITESFKTFINKQVGHWASERTYHYIGGPVNGKELEQSTTVFQVAPLNSGDISKVFTLNEVPQDESACGFRVIFDTIMRNTGRKVHAETDVVFLCQQVSPRGVLSGVYLRSQGYEDKDPAAATFTFTSGMDVGVGQLNMVTRYSQVVSVDQITLMDDDTRLRRIVNYKRPQTSEEPLKEIQLLGFGVEKRGEKELV